MGDFKMLREQWNNKRVRASGIIPCLFFNLKSVTPSPRFTGSPVYFCFCYFFNFKFVHSSHLLGAGCMSHTDVLYHFVSFCVKMDHKFCWGLEAVTLLWFANLFECFIRETWAPGFLPLQWNLKSFIYIESWCWQVTDKHLHYSSYRN